MPRFDPEYQRLLAIAQEAINRGMDPDTVLGRLRENEKFQQLPEKHQTLEGLAEAAGTAQNPGPLTGLLRQAQEQLRQGASMNEVNQAIAQQTEGQHESLSSLRRAVAPGRPEQVNQILGRMRGDNLSPEQEEALGRQAERPGGAVSDFMRMAAQGATFEFGDEIAGLAGGVGAAARAIPEGPGGVLEAFQTGREESTAASRQRVEDIRTLNPGSALAAEVAGGLGTGGAATALGREMVKRVAPRVAQALPQAGQSVGQFLRGPGTGPTRRTPTQQMGRSVAVGGGVGAAATGTFGAGAAEGGVGERLAAGGRIAPLGLLGGSVLGASGGLFGAAFGRAGSTGRTRRAGETIAEDLQATSGRHRPPSEIRRVAEDKRQAARTIFRQLEDEGVIPAKIDTLVRENPTLKAQLGRLRGVPKEIASGEKPITFTQADDIAKNLREEADFFARGGGGTTPGRSDRVRQASEAFEELDTAMREALDGFPEAKRLWAQNNAEMRALTTGRTVVSKTADDIEDTLQRLPDDVGMPTDLSPAEAAEYADELRKIAQEGMLHEHVARLTSQRGSAFKPAAEAQKMFHAGPETRAQLRQIFPDEASFNEFTRLLDAEASAVTIADKLKVLITAGAFLGGGTSVFAKLVTGG